LKRSTGSGGSLLGQPSSWSNALDRAGVEVGGLDREIVGAIVGVADLDRDRFTRR
jgi:hypothetical protein